jgi:hypothetical protein
MYPVISLQPLSAFASAMACAGGGGAARAGVLEQMGAKALWAALMAIVAVGAVAVGAVAKGVLAVIQSVMWMVKVVGMVVEAVERSTGIGRSAFGSIKATDVENTNATNRSVRRVLSKQSSAFTEPSITPRNTVPNESVSDFSQAPPLRR